MNSTRDSGRDTAADGGLSARAGRTALALAGMLDDISVEAGESTRPGQFFRVWAEYTCAAPEAAGKPQPVPALERLAGAFALTDLEVELVLLAGLPHEHEGLARTFRNLSAYDSPWPTAGMAALAAAGGDRDLIRRVLSSGNAALSGILTCQGDDAFFERPVRLGESLWEALHGTDAWPGAIERVPLPDTAGILAGLSGWLELPVVRRCVMALTHPAPRSLVVQERDTEAALWRACALAGRAGVRVVAARCDPSDPAVLRLILAHCALRGAVPILLPAQNLANVAQAHSQFDLTLAGYSGPVILCPAGNGLVADPRRPILPVPSTGVAKADRRRAWSAALPHLAADAAQLAARHPVDPSLAAQIGVDARDQAILDGADVESGAVPHLIRARSGVTLPAGIRLTEPNVPWTRLVVPAEAAWQLRDAVARLELQSMVLDDWGMRDSARAARGTRLLFTGPPGTGKTLAAEAMATAAGTDLLLVDVSQVVSKWIGETEKNLAAAFDVAERTQAVLLLDEADALFAKRTDVSDAHDRHANLETSYLLQRLDQFDGLVILATNLRHNIDAAFVRRMDFVVDFPLPDLRGREDLWSIHLPAGHLAPDVDIDALARLYPVPGGWIRNAAIGASFVAAGRGSSVQQQHVLDAVRREYSKAALPFPGSPPRRDHDHHE
ncbi:hypothetical protein J2X01_000302 [Arthrobacter ginsengisoli]|uniref:AAA+ ATPase domain-containing protein n=1 Tax=Arthrobacter ginsengisoli TaxID=1356565 RepID=A0ABU1U760_9MICC|nr:ATP-binding protein [Arthrobacter ginsengisoli]MDR7081033.1 hypothetical protein [Arthrobacter ginsengisoli]